MAGSPKSYKEDPSVSPPPRVRPFRFKDTVDTEHTYMASASSSTRHRHQRHRRHRSSSRDRSSRRRHPRRYDEGKDGSRDRGQDGRRSPFRSRSPSYGHRHRRSTSRSPGPPARDLSPETAFRESLFDAMADDEGAAYWEGVYGQPIHNFGPMPSQQRESGETYEGEDYNNPEVLDADAYATYVRRKMWERSHQAVLEERAKREAARKKVEEEMKKEKEARRRRNAERGDTWENNHSWRRKDGADPRREDSFQTLLDESLKRGENRREQKRWREAWERYTLHWDLISGKGTAKGSASASKGVEKSLDDEDAEKAPSSLPWPVRSGKQADVDAGNVRDFFKNGPMEVAKKTSMGSNVDMKGLLKTERVRWHPDKIMQRFSEAVGEDALKSVTAVFQTIDQLWNEQKSIS